MNIEFIEDAAENAAFQEDPAAEYARILRKVADEIEAGRTYGVMHDYNGNRVGTWEK